MSKKNLYRSHYFSLDINQKNNNTTLRMKMGVPLVNTRSIPHTFSFLKSHAPSVLATRCFNDLNLAFDEEVKATELGHLFEHILLEQLCVLKISAGFANAVFNGRTYWNWERDPTGVFHIVIDIGKKEIALLLTALQNTIQLFESLLFGQNLQATTADHL